MRELTGEEIVRVLDENRFGVLALDGGTFPYPLPITYGYDTDDDQLVLHVEGGDESHKHRCIDMNDHAGFLVYEETVPDEVWQSVVLRGRLAEIAYETAESAFATLAMNAQQTPNPTLWSDSATVTPYQFHIQERTGREFDIRDSIDA